MKLRVAFGSVPEVGTELRTERGRRYQVIGVKGKTLTCLVLPPDAEVQGIVWLWQWAPRAKSKRPVLR